MQNGAGYISARIIQLGYIQQDAMAEVVQECVTQHGEKMWDNYNNTKLKKLVGHRQQRNFYTEQKSVGDSRMSWQGRIYQLYVRALHCCENPWTFSRASYLAPPTTVASHRPRSCAGSTLPPIGSE